MLIAVAFLHVFAWRTDPMWCCIMLCWPAHVVAACATKLRCLPLSAPTFLHVLLTLCSHPMPCCLPCCRRCKEGFAAGCLQHTACLTKLPVQYCSHTTYFACLLAWMPCCCRYTLKIPSSILLHVLLTLCDFIMLLLACLPALLLWVACSCLPPTTGLTRPMPHAVLRACRLCRLQVHSEDSVLWTAQAYVSTQATPEQQQAEAQQLAPLVRCPHLSQLWLTAMVASPHASKLLLGQYIPQIHRLLPYMMVYCPAGETCSHSQCINTC